MASAPLNWLLKIGSAALKTTEQTLTGAVNELKDSISSLQSQTGSQFSTVAADMSKKVNKTDALSLEEIEATTNLTDKIAAAEAVKEVNASLTSFQVGVNKVVSAVNSKAGTSLTAKNSCDEIVNAINNISISGTKDFTLTVNRSDWANHTWVDTYKIRVNCNKGVFSASIISRSTSLYPIDGASIS